ncbi:hypothetical protein SLA2020_505370 [Shorea laevis]
MASKQSTLLRTISVFMFILSFLATSSSLSLDLICDSTPYPSFCKSHVFLDKNQTMLDYCRISLNQSLSSAQNLLSLVEYYLNLSSTSSLSATRALEDCQLLASLNIDFLSNTLQSINSQDNLDSSQADDFLSLLSATVTNQETCLDGLNATSSAEEIKNNLMPLLSNGTMVLSMSLAFFKLGWVHDQGTKQGRWLKECILNRDQELFKFLRGRKLLQDIGQNVNVSKLVVVNPNGSGDFTTISAAVTAAPNYSARSQQYFVIHVVAGVYNEYVSIPNNKQNLMMIGDGISRTVITGDRSVADGWTTFNSATFAVVGQGFVAVNITFRNTAGAIKGQAVALRSSADLSAFYSCSFEGYQDTLYTYSLRQFYRDCDIYGTVDFIFGNAAVVFQNCNIYPRLPILGQADTITAQGRSDPNQNTGTSMHNCNIKAAENLGTTKTYLGRPWKMYSRTVYMQSFMDSLIDPAGWDQWSGNFALSTLYYAEFSNRGPGSDTSQRVTWPGYHIIDATVAVNFTVSNFIQGQSWLPSTGVPFDAALL